MEMVMKGMQAAEVFKSVPMLFIFILSALAIFSMGYCLGVFDKERPKLSTWIKNFSPPLRRAFSLFLFTVLILVTLTIHYKLPEKFDIGEMAKFVVSGLVVIGLFYTILTFEYNFRKNREDKRIIEVQGSFDILSQWYVPPLSDYTRAIYVFEGTDKYQLLKNNLDEFHKFFNSRTDDSFKLRDATN
jgi:hypothetical protein